MKPLLFLLLAAVLALPSCKKKQCWRCVTSMSYTPSNGMQPTITQSTICDQTAEDIDNLQKQNTTTSTSGSVTVRQTMQCTPE